MRSGSRPALGQNMLGYIVWHIPRSQDRFRADVDPRRR